jgi:hypothetical protein
MPAKPEVEAKRAARSDPAFATMWRLIGSGLGNRLEEANCAARDGLRNQLIPKRRRSSQPDGRKLETPKVRITHG